MTDPLAGTVFLDTAYAIALINRDDALHRVALGLADRLQQSRTRLLTTRAIFLEIGDGLCRPLYRSSAAAPLTAMQEDPALGRVELTPSLYAEALALYSQRRDKGWGLTA